MEKMEKMENSRKNREMHSIVKSYFRTSCQHFCLVYMYGREHLTQMQESLQPELNLIASARISSGSMPISLQTNTAKLYSSSTCYTLQPGIKNSQIKCHMG